ncbi:MAG: hypothetical protein A3K19_16475 [Lentisphaerae bacterium RIFOXYB12_FULL_65_16]|nr:MAG: hypothetical protein A3K18_24585 [Lentisphaerae bacterium RIFOXYA12_64_32]OGV89039.1 MAG: hypothetical protein A3K19_16475 [Lentisphaerae bacterium RIFOXYB12_FULL_65_16]
MRKVFLTGLMAAGMLAFCGRAWACEDDLVRGMDGNFTHGLVNIVTGWYEVPHQIHKGYNKGIGDVNESPALSRSAGAVMGTFRGASQAVGRTGWGVIQLGGFWSRNPNTNREFRPLLDGEYSWEKGTKKEFLCPTFKDGWNRMAPRMQRGFRNIVGAVPEIPGQVVKGDRQEKNSLKGFGKGVWFCASRAVQGTGEFVMFPVASPEENFNVPFEEIEGWDAVHGRYNNNVPPK